MPGEITKELFGQTKDGKDVLRFTLKNSSGNLVVKIIEYGAAVNEINVPDQNGKVADVTLGFDDMAGYESSNLYLGAIVGRVANRIAGGQFTLDGKTYNLFVNNGPNTNHGGKAGFDKKLWSGSVDGDKLVMKYVSPDGEEGFPGELTTTVTYRVTDDNALSVDIEATTTKPTPVNPLCHAYFNLAGHDAGTLDDHVVTIPADSTLVLDENSVPTGEIKKVEGTLLDLRKPVRLGDRLQQLPGGKGFDNNYCFPPNDGKLQLAARVEHPPTGRFLECQTTQPGMQFYTSFYLNVPSGKGGASYKQFGALCLETQHYPDSVHQRLWRGKVEGDRLVLTYVSADGEEGFPGELTTTVTYRVTDDNELFIEYEATTTKPTPVNLTNHAFFNLAGHDAANMDDHLLTVPADTFLPQDEDFVPTGEIKKVEGTVWDLRKPARLGERIPQIPGGRGINENYCLPPNDSGKLQLAARFEHPPSGRYMECLTTEPGMQVYTGYFLDVPRAKAGATYGRFGAIVLEAQHYPDSVNRPSFPNTILRPGETYRQTTIYKFGVA